MQHCRFVILFVFLAASIPAISQNPGPKIIGYVSVVHPIVTFSENNTTFNFKDYYLVGFPTGINIWKSAQIGFSFEVTPYIRAQNGTSKMSNLLFHPGILIAMGHGYTFTGRAAFETSGRYGLTPVFTKIIKKNKGTNYFIAIPLPARFGNEQTATYTIGLQFGISF